MRRVVDNVEHDILLARSIDHGIRVHPEVGEDFVVGTDASTGSG
jgi:hypothetical protein